MTKPIFRVHFSYVNKNTPQFEIDHTITCTASDPDEARKMALATVRNDAVTGTVRVRKIKRVRS